MAPGNNRTKKLGLIRTGLTIRPFFFFTFFLFLWEKRRNLPFFSRKKSDEKTFLQILISHTTTVVTSPPRVNFTNLMAQMRRQSCFITGSVSATKICPTLLVRMTRKYAQLLRSILNAVHQKDWRITTGVKAAHRMLMKLSPLSFLFVEICIILVTKCDNTANLLLTLLDTFLSIKFDTSSLANRVTKFWQFNVDFTQC